VIILRRNAMPLYFFLSVMNAHLSEGETLQGRKILDCGAGGVLPPLALFHQHGLEGWGIDVSAAQLDKARAFCAHQGIDLHLRQGDMRHLPFDDATFDYAYEHYSMCHLSHADTARAVDEMRRVLKDGGLGFLGVISTDTWPKASFGEERAPGEFLGHEYGDEPTLHSMFTDDAADQLVAAWEVLAKEKRVSYMREVAAETTLDEWMALHTEAEDGCTSQAWQARYPTRVQVFKYVHTYYFVRKPA